MKLRLFPLLTMLLIATLAFAGCQPQGPAIPGDPVEAVKLIADKQNDVTSEHLDVTLDFTLKADGFPDDDPSAIFLKNFKANVTAAGDVDSAKQDFQFAGSADLGALTAFLAQGEDKLEFEVRKVGDTVYTRAAGQDWSEAPATTSTDSSQPNPADLEQLTEILKKAAQAEKLADESIDGTDSYHFKVTLDAVELISEFANLAESSAPIDEEQLAQARELLKDSEVTVDLWVGKADLIIRQEKIHFGLDLKNVPDMPAEVTMQMTLDIAVKLSKLNEAVTITAP